jgi:5'-3' exonuclease
LYLDTSSLTYRAFFALPPSIREPHGRPVNAAHGYLDFTATLIASRRPDEVVA